MATILGIESSSLVASAAVVTDDTLTAEYTVNYKKTHSQTLLPMIAEITKMIELDLDKVDAIAVSAGPGSFTGLRIGSATGKGLGLAMNKPLIEVPTLDAMAYNLWGCKDLICPIMDAKRDQVFTGLYHCERELEILRGQCALDIKELTDIIDDIGEEVVFIGDGVPVFRDRIEEYLNVPFAFAPAQNNRSRAASVAALGLIYFNNGNIVTAADFKPEYLRKSQAERIREEKHGDVS